MAPTATFVLTQRLDTVPAARRFARQSLDGVPAGLVDDASTVVTELVTNAVLHGTAPATLQVRSDGSGVRVEVRDAGRARPVIPLHNTEAMTGRGLGLVAAVATSWGVEPARDGGKVVWAELTGQAPANGSGPDVDLEALLAKWSPEPTPEPLYTVTLGAVPTKMLLAAKYHIDNVVREFTLAGVHGDAPGRQPQRLVSAVTQSFASARADIKRQALAAAARGELETELILTQPASAADAGEEYLEALDEADRYARAARLLTLAAPPVHRVFRRWYVQSLVDQIRALAQDREPSSPRSLIDVLCEEVTELAPVRDSWNRLQILQRVTGELTGAQTMEDIADAVARNAVEHLGALTASVYVVEGDTLRALAIVGEGGIPVDPFRLIAVDAQLPMPYVVRTGKALMIQDVSKAVAMFPALAGINLQNRSLHIAPLIVGAHRLGALVLGFTLGQVDETAQAPFVRALADSLAQALERALALREAAEMGRRSALLSGPDAPDVNDLLSSAQAAAFVFHADDGRVVCDQRLLDLYGITGAPAAGAALDVLLTRLHPDDEPRLRGALTTAIETDGPLAVQYRIVLESGEVRHVLSQGQAVTDDYGKTRVLGLSYLSSADRDVDTIMSALGVAIVTVDRQWNFATVNTQAEELLGRPRSVLIGQNMWQEYPASIGTDFETNFRTAVETGESVAFDAYYPEPLDAWYEVRAWPTSDGLSVYFVNITAHRKQQEAAERALFRAALLASVTDALTGPSRPEESVGRLARLVVPALADWCIVTLVVGEEGDPWRSRLRDVSAWHSDPAVNQILKRYVRVRLAAHSETSYLKQVLDTGQPYFVTSPADSRGSLLPGEAQDIFQSLVPASAMVLPLRANGRTLGIVSLSWETATEPPPEAVDLATEVAGRAGLALENARLSAQQRTMSEGLQRSLLTAPPQPDHVQIAVRYEPAAEATQIGGDWYDAFLQQDGATWLVIGDVSGHDVDAAVAMGQVRGLLRGIAVSDRAGPAQVIGKLDAAMQTLLVDVLASAVVARIEQTTEDLAQGLTRLRWSNAGHPPPLVVHHDGRVEVLEGGEPDLLLGIDPTTARTESVAVLKDGATVFFYTDGLVERHGQSLDQGIGRLGEVLAGLHGQSLDEVCDTVLNRMTPGRRDDDVAIVAVRLVPPAPPERVPPRGQ